MKETKDKDTIITVDLDPEVEGEDAEPNCPFITDVNSCAILKDSPINFCPISKEDGDLYTHPAPDNCPLRKGRVIVREEQIEDLKIPDGWIPSPGEVTPGVNYTKWFELPEKYEMEVYWDKGGDGYHYIHAIKWHDDWNNMIRRGKARTEKGAMKRAVEIMEELSKEAVDD